MARLLGAAAVISLLLGGIPAVAAPPPESQAAKAPARLTATIRAVDSKAGTLELFTGVGHALRLVRMQVDPTSRIKAAGAPAGLGDLKPGRIVRIEYGVSAERSLALTIETVEPESAGGTR